MPEPRVVDVSHPIAEGLATLVDLPAVVLHRPDPGARHPRGRARGSRRARRRGVLHTRWDRHVGTRAFGTGVAVPRGELPEAGARFTAATPAIAGFGTVPVRAFAIVR